MRLLQSHTLALAFLGAVPGLAADNIQNIEIHKDYGAPIEGHTKYLTEENGKTTYRIGVNTEYLTEGPVTTTIDNKPVTTTITSHIVVSTATKGSGKIDDEDVLVLLPENIRKEVEDVVMQAYEACSVAPKMAKRQDGTCMLDRLAESAQSDGFLSSVPASEWEGFGVKFAKDAPGIIKHYAKMVAGLTTTEQKFYIGAAAAMVAGIEITKTVLPPKKDIKKVPPGLKFPQGQFGAVDAEGGQGDSPTTTECPYPTETPSEEWPACPDEDCVGKNKICTAKGKNKDCPCINYAEKEIGGDQYDVEFGLNQYKILDRAERELLGPDNEPTCDNKADLSKVFSSELFDIDEKNAQKDYCKDWDQKKESEMLVDPDGTASGSIGERSTDGWMVLKYQPKDKGGDCGQTCSRALERLTDKCSVKTEMREKGTYDIGCGEFKYEIIKPKKPEDPAPPKGENLKPKAPVCWGAKDYKRKGDIKESDMVDLSSKLCEWDGKPVRKGDEASFRHWKHTDNWARGGETYQYNIWWLDGCELQSGKESQEAWNPEEKNGWAGECESYFYKSYKDCNNGGRGGAVQVGCLMYEFAAYKSRRNVWDKVIYY